MGKEALIVDDVSMKFNLSSEKVDNIKACQLFIGQG